MNVPMIRRNAQNVFALDGKTVIRMNEANHNWFLNVRVHSSKYDKLEIVKTASEIMRKHIV